MENGSDFWTTGHFSDSTNNFITGTGKPTTPETGTHSCLNTHSLKSDPPPESLCPLSLSEWGSLLAWVRMLLLALWWPYSVRGLYHDAHFHPTPPPPPRLSVHAAYQGTRSGDLIRHHTGVAMGAYSLDQQCDYGAFYSSKTFTGAPNKVDTFININLSNAFNNAKSNYFNFSYHSRC